MQINTTLLDRGNLVDGKHRVGASLPNGANLAFASISFVSLSTLIISVK